MPFDFFNCKNINSKNHQRGFTLIEVLVALAIMGILAAIAMPSFTATIRRYRADAIRDDVIASLQLARSEAIRRGLPDTTPITITRTPTATAPCTVDTTTAGVWSCGWQIYQDNNNNQVFDAAGDNLIQQFTVPNGFSVTETSAASANTIIANRWGQFSSSTSLVIAPIISGTNTASDPSANAVCLGTGGKLTKIKHTTGDVACP